MPGDVERSLHMEGGHRRIDRVLSPAFVENLPDLSLAEVKQRRDEALAEREYLSLLRRLVHGRLDILRAEAARRGRGDRRPTFGTTMAPSDRPPAPAGSFATGGVIQIGGKAVNGYGQDRGVVFQDFAQLFPWRTALGNVTFGLVTDTNLLCRFARLSSVGRW